MAETLRMALNASFDKRWLSLQIAKSVICFVSSQIHYVMSNQSTLAESPAHRTRSNFPKFQSVDKDLSPHCSRAKQVDRTG